MHNWWYFRKRERRIKKLHKEVYRLLENQLEENFCTIELIKVLCGDKDVDANRGFWGRIMGFDTED